jgi:shikimate dehydrogenase
MPSSAVQPLLALLACPVGGNPTQYMIERACAKHDLDWRYLTFEVSPENLDDAVRGLRALGFSGAHCAAPHKKAVIPLLKRVSETSAAVGAVNLIYREDGELIGDNAEGRGVLEAIVGTLDPAGKHVVLLGAGQLARAIAIELVGRRPASLTIFNRTESKAADLASLVSPKTEMPVSVATWQNEYAIPAETELLINATSIGHGEEDAALPLAVDSLRPELCIADASWTVAETQLLADARARGCKTVDGLTMFVEQVAIALRLWTGVDPSREVMREAAEEFLGL